MINKQLLLFIVLMVAVAIPLSSAVTPPTVYVDTDGSGDYDCDGTDDHVQINQALAFVGSNAGYYTVHLNGSNTYWINLTLDMYEDTTFEGDSDAEIKLINNAGWGVTKPPLISNVTQGSNNFTIQGFIIDGNSENQTEGLGAGYYNMMYFKSCHNVTVDNMRLEWGNGDGLKIQFFGSHAANPANTVFTNNSVYKLGHDACYILSGRYITAAHNDVFTRTNSAVRLTACSHALIYNNSIYSLRSGSSTGPGIEIDNNGAVVCENVSIYNNTLNNLNGAGIWITTNEVVDNDVINCRDVYIHHNIFNRVGLYWVDTGYSNAAIIIGQNNNTIIENNIIYMSGHAGIKYYIHPSHYHIKETFTTIVRNNIITHSYLNVATGIWNYNSTNHTFISEYNCFYNNTGSSDYNGTNITYSNDLYVNPLYYNITKDYLLVQDFHLNSTVGTWNGTGWEVMSADSPCIDAGKPSSDYSLEPTPNGSRINIGRYGNTSYASKSSSWTPPSASIWLNILHRVYGNGTISYIGTQPQESDTNLTNVFEPRVVG